MRRSGIDPIAVDEEEGRHDGVELDDASRLGIPEVAILQLASYRGLGPEVVRPGPRLVVHVHEVLVVEVYPREIALVCRRALCGFFLECIQLGSSLRYRQFRYSVLEVVRARFQDWHENTCSNSSCQICVRLPALPHMQSGIRKLHSSEETAWHEYS